MAVFLLQNVDPPILPNIFAKVVPLRGDAASRAAAYLAARSPPPPHQQPRGGAPRNAGQRVDASSRGDGVDASSCRDADSVYRNLKVMPRGGGGEAGAGVLVLDGAGQKASIAGIDGKPKTVCFHDSVEALAGSPPTPTPHTPHTQTDRQTGRQTDRHKSVASSPPICV
jgi:hypothetical protein